MKFENYLSDLFAFQKFDENSGLKEMTDSVRKKYHLDEEDVFLDMDDLCMAAGGIGIDTVPDKDTMKGQLI